MGSFDVVQLKEVGLAVRRLATIRNPWPELRVIGGGLVDETGTARLVRVERVQVVIAVIIACNVRA